MRIALEVRRTLDLRALQAGRRLYLYRLWTRVRFRQTRGWSEDHLAIVDTGAPYSVIPAAIWPALRTQRLAETPLRGIVPGKDAKVTAVLSRISGQVLDSRNASFPLKLWAMLVRTESVPLILGWLGFLDRCKLVLNSPRHSAWLEF